jgi:thioredoxin reductase (NADPH)
MLVTVENLKTKELYNISSDGIFVFVGMSPNLENFKDNPEFDDWGYIKTDEDMRTSIKDVFAIGDVRSKNYRQITTAVADGTIAAIVVSKELE